MSRKTLLAVSIALVAALMLSSVAYAITIIVDGVREAAWDGSGGQTPGIQDDPDESGIDDRYDITEVRWTNDALGSAPWGNLFFFVETHGNYDDTFPAFDPGILICIDTDNTTSTGTTASGYCNNMAGIDRTIRADLRNLIVTVRRWTGSSFVTVVMPSGGMRSVAWQDIEPDGIANLPYVEIGVDLQSLGITSSSTCLGAMPTAIYYDNGMADPEDTVPDSGTFATSCGSPTAVTLESLQAQPTTSPVVPAALVGISAAALIGIVYLIRRRKTA
jgi:hypothetical protein